MKEKRTLC